MSTASQLILGLDLGSASIGFALVRLKEAQEGEIVQIGVRIFEEAITPKEKVPKNRNRRQKRGARTLYRRRRQRRRLILDLLIQSGLLPEDAQARDALLHDSSRHPYLQRKEALDSCLSAHEVGRIIFHLAQRRGFKSNRKASGIEGVDDPDILALIQEEEEREMLAAAAKEKRAREAAAQKGREYAASAEDAGVVLSAIATLRDEIESSGSRTLGEYLAGQIERGLPARRRHTERAMIEHEFEMIWAHQAKGHPQMTDSLRAQVHQAIFWQRPLRGAERSIGTCQYEKGRKRLPTAHPLAQKVRILQDVNHITIRQPGQRDPSFLTAEQRSLVSQTLLAQGELSWSKFRSIIKAGKNTVINLQEGGMDKLKGDRTSLGMRSAIGDRWNSMNDDQQDRLFEQIRTIDDKSALIRRLRSEWGFAPREAYALATWEPEYGYASLSRRAMRRILPHLEAGLNHHDACQAAGYQRIDQKPKGAQDRLEVEDIPKLANPVVSKALHEVRRVLNTLIREHGKPDVIRIEMARELKLNKERQADVIKAIKKNEKLNELAVERAQALGIVRPSRKDKLKYRLWKECEGVCPYTGTIIPESMLFSPQVDVEHIIPWSVSIDDSYANKTLCMAEENRLVKSKKTPYQAYSSMPERYAEILERVDRFPHANHKKKLFRMRDIPEDFASRQLNDTSYICTEVMKFVGRLGVSVEVSKGAATAALRRRWGLNSILAEDGEKTRADHRHHAVDALVIALTSRSLFQRLSRESATTGAGLSDRELVVPEPWTDFRAQAERAVRQIVVSHQATRKVRGALHQETAYGWREGEGRYVLRKPIASLTNGEIERIRDVRIRAQVQEQVAQQGIASLADSNHPITLRDRRGEPVYDSHGHLRVVKRVRLNAREKPGSLIPVGPHKHFANSVNHHLMVLEAEDGCRDFEVVSMFEAARRIANGEPLFKSSSDRPGWRVVLHLCANDIVRMAGEHSGLWRVNSFNMSPSFREVILQRLSDSMPARESLMPIQRITSPKTMQFFVSRVILDAIGTIIAEERCRGREDR